MSAIKSKMVLASLINCVSIQFQCELQQSSSMVEHPLVVQWVIGSILHDGHIELFLSPDIAPQLN